MIEMSLVTGLTVHLQVSVNTECPQGNQNEIPWFFPDFTWSTNRNSLMIRHHLTPAEFDTSTAVIATCDATRHYTTWHMYVGLYVYLTNTTTVTSSVCTHPSDWGIHQWYKDVTNRVVYQYCPHSITLPGKIPSLTSFPCFPEPVDTL